MISEIIKLQTHFIIRYYYFSRKIILMEYYLGIILYDLNSVKKKKTNN